KTHQVSQWQRPNYRWALKWNGDPLRRVGHRDSWMSLESFPRCKRILAKELFYSSDVRGLNFYVSS
ncbi:hypothetical protein HispidOSU_009092, partial [Sigmodon hispidus]